MMKYLYIVCIFFCCNDLYGQSIVAAEYFWDNDPGLGSGNAIVVSGATQIANLNINAGTTGLTSGVHYLYIRSKGSNGKWSLSEGRMVNIVPSVTSAEYFWDTDPGVGSGVQIAISPADSAGFNFNFPTNGLTPGIHTLYIRSKGSNGRWSLTEGRAVSIVPAVVAAEYFWDTDPGVGAGNSVSLTPSDSLPYNFSFSTDNLAAGVHFLYIRTKDNYGKWSLSEPRMINTVPSVRNAEYFWDNDPGIGSGIPVTVAASDSALLNISFPTNNLTEGDHYLYIRTKGNGSQWSLSEGRKVKIIRSIVAAEYFWDADPGQGAATALSISPSDSVFINATFSAAGLSEGTHYLYVRTKDNTGKWSLSEGRAINFNRSIVAAEYFWNTDPGTGAGIPIPVTASDSAFINTTFSTTGLNTGDHYLYFRSKDYTGKWSLAERRMITIAPAALNLSFFLEGLYAGNGMMNSALYPSTGSHPEVADTITIRMYSPSDLNTPVYIQKSVLNINGTSTFFLPADLLGGSYYVSIRNRNIIETWSKTPLLIDQVQVSLNLKNSP